MNHYNEAYFNYQAPIGEFGGWANLTKFSDYISDTDTVLDFGCGGGYLLKNITAAKKLGVEINPDAIKQAVLNGVKVYSSAKDIDNNSVDVIISNHALEHMTRPFDDLIELHRILKMGGSIIFVIPCETVQIIYEPNDINKHLYSWSPMSLGNLFTEAGFKVIESKAYWHKWPPNYRELATLGRKVFDEECYKYALANDDLTQVRIIGYK
jgi:SAM-dependent methyltransferase